MHFQYDPKKAASNLRKHGVSFSDAEGVFFDPLAVHVPDPDSETEERWVVIGQGSAGAILVVVYAHRGEAIRLISARRATKREGKEYAS